MSTSKKKPSNWEIAQRQMEREHLKQDALDLCRMVTSLGEQMRWMQFDKPVQEAAYEMIEHTLAEQRQGSGLPAVSRHRSFSGAK
jgi:hypothetical protein